MIELSEHAKLIRPPLGINDPPVPNFPTVGAFIYYIMTYIESEYHKDFSIGYHSGGTLFAADFHAIYQSEQFKAYCERYGKNFRNYFDSCGVATPL